MAVTTKNTDLVFGLELGAQLSAVATGVREEVEKTANVGGIAKVLKTFTCPSTVAFSGLIRLHGEEAGCRVNFEPKDTLMCVPLWIPVRTIDDGREVEKRLTSAPLVEVGIDKENVTFFVDVDKQKVGVDLPVVVGDYVRYLRNLALVLNSRYEEHMRGLRGTQLRQHLHTLQPAAAHVGVVVVPSFVQQRDVKVVMSGLSVAGITMEIMSRTAAVVNWWCCEHLPKEFYTLADKQIQLAAKQEQQQQQEAGKSGGGTAAGAAAAVGKAATGLLTTAVNLAGGAEGYKDQVVRVGILDFGSADTTCVILELKKSATGPEQSGPHPLPQREVAVKVLAGETAANLGRLDIVRLFAKHVQLYLKDTFKVEIRDHSERFWKLSLACSKCIHALCDVEKSVVDLDDFIVKKTDLRMQCSRHHLRQTCESLVQAYQTLFQNTLKKAGLQGSQIDVLDVIGNTVRIPWLLELVESTFACPVHAPHQQQQAAATAGEPSCKLRLLGIRSSSVGALGAAYFAVGKRYVHGFKDDGEKLYTQDEVDRMMALENKLSAIERNEMRRREIFAKLVTFVMEIRHAALSTHKALLLHTDQTAKMIKEMEATARTLRDASEERIEKFFEDFRGFFEKNEPKIFEVVEGARLKRLDQEKAISPKSAMDLLVRHIGEDKDANLPLDALLDRSRRDLEETKRLLECGQFDLGIYLGDKALRYIKSAEALPASNTAVTQIENLKMDAYLQLAKAQTLKAEHDRAIDERAELLEAAVSNATAALKLSPNNVDALLLRSRAYMASKHYDAAEEDARAGLAVQQGNLPLQALIHEIEQRKPKA